MPHVSYESAVDAPVETAWNLIVEKSEHPERFYPGIRSVTILERTDKGFIRRIMTEGGEERTERFVVDETHLQATATLIDHPVYSGTAVCRISLLEAGPLLHCDLNWSPIAGVEPAGSSDLRQEVLNGLKSVVDRAEGRSPAWLATG